MFVIDDVIGKFGLDNVVFSLLSRYEDILVNFIMLKIKVFMICWEVVFKYEVFLGFILLNKKYLV